MKILLEMVKSLKKNVVQRNRSQKGGARDSTKAPMQIKIEVFLALLALVVSVFSWQASVEANKYSKLSLQNQFDTKFSVKCLYNYDAANYLQYKLVKVTGALYQIEASYNCSISNLSGKAITVNGLDALIYRDSQAEKQDLLRTFKISSIKDTVKDTKLPLTWSTETNMQIELNQQLGMSLTVLFSITDKYEDFLKCDHVLTMDNSSIFCDSKLKSEQDWERMLEISNINNDDNDLYIQFNFKTIDGVEKYAKTCLPYRSCGKY